MKQIEAIVSGKVQGVGFRMYTQKKARQLDVRGYVKNLSNGDVEIVAVGEVAAVDALIEWAKNGSPSAAVKNIRVKTITDTEDFANFAIRR